MRDGTYGYPINIISALIIFLLLSSIRGLAADENQSPSPPVQSMGSNVPVPGYQKTAAAQGGVYRLYYGTREQLTELAVHYEPWEVNTKAGYAVLELDGQSVAALRDRGFRLELDEDRTSESLRGPEGYPCYRDVDTLYADLQQIAALYPDLTEWIDYGDSWLKLDGQSGYDLWILKMTSDRYPTAKPCFFLMATIHARELTTPETAMTFINYLLDNYDMDADATWLLDHHEIYVVVVANPDGRQLVEQGCSQRKNRNDTLGDCNVCSSWNQYGVDLNRNNPYHWGGAGTDPCGMTYQGTAAASEPETVFLNEYIRLLFPDQRPDDDVTPAPDDAAGLLISLHSYGNLVLWPWGWTYDGAPNETQLQTLGRKFAWYNNYTPQQASDLYTTTGDTTDWAYGELGVAAYTFELGESFFQPCGHLQEIMDENLGALIYGAKVCRTPYMTPAGPDALALSLSTGAVASGDPVQLTAILDDARYNNSNGAEPQQNIAAGEYYIDTPPWMTAPSPVSFPMTASDGGFDSPNESVEADVDTSGLDLGRHILFVRGRDADGNWGAFSACFLYIVDPAVSPTIEGFVLEAGTNAPLDAVATAGFFQTNTNPATGFFSMTVVSGAYTLSAVSDAHGVTAVTGIQANDYQTVHQDLTLFPMLTVFEDDVESGNQGWTAEGNWAITAENSCSDSHSWTDSPGADYGRSWDISLISPVLDLSDYEEITLGFQHIYDLEDGYDYGYVEYSTDGGAGWTQANSYNGEDHTTWTQADIPFSALNGESDARFRFRLDTDGSVAEDGWHIDDITLRGCLSNVKGDLNGDGAAGAEDVMILAHYLAGEINGIPVGNTKGDLTGDSKINAIDLTELLVMLSE